MPVISKKWHSADKQPCVTCKRWIPLEIPLHFLGMGYECHKCYLKRTKRVMESVKKIEKHEEKGRICAECGLPDYTYLHEVKNWTYTLIPIKMYFTSDRKLICQRCVTEAQLSEWWNREMAKPRLGHPSYYSKHDPFAKVCTCDHCNDRTTKTNNNLSNSK